MDCNMNIVVMDLKLLKILKNNFMDYDLLL